MAEHWKDGEGSRYDPKEWERFLDELNKIHQEKKFYMHCGICDKKVELERNTLLDRDYQEVEGLILIANPCIICLDCNKGETKDIDGFFPSDNCNGVDKIEKLVYMEACNPCLPRLDNYSSCTIIHGFDFKKTMLDSMNFFCDLFDNSPRIYAAISQRLSWEGFQKEAIAIVENAIERANNKYSKNALLLHKAALIIDTNENLDEANNLLSLIEQSTELDSLPTSYYFIKGELFSLLGKHSEAEAFLKTSCALAKKYKTRSWLPWLRLGNYYLCIKQDFIRAEKTYKEACTTSPLFRPFLMGLGDSLFFQNKYSEALKYYKKAREFYAKYPVSEKIRKRDKKDNMLRKRIEICEKKLRKK